MKKFLMTTIAGLSILCIIGISSCGGGKTCSVGAFNSDVNAAIQQLNTAINAYAAEQTEANCNAYKDAAQNYLDEVRTFSDCAADIGQANYDAAVDAAQEAVNSITCN